MTYTQHESAEAVILAPQTPPTATVIWLHGLGADGFDFAPIVPELRLSDALAVRFVFPHARARPVTINNGVMMRAWYDITALGPTRTEDEIGVRESAEVVGRFIEQEVRAGVPEKRIVIAGFSQGGAIALHTALRYPKRLAGVMGLSTYLPLSAQLESEASPANRETPALLCHGVRDPVLTLALGEAARARLQGLGYHVEWRTYPMEHQVCTEEIADIARWLTTTLSASAQ